jgi:WD40 repeat protein
VAHGAVSLHAVTLDESGNAYLNATAFVLRLAGVPRAPSTASAAESGHDEPITSATDVSGLGLLTSQVLGGESPVEGGSAPTASPPSRLADVIERATTDRAEERFSSVDTFLAALGAVFDRHETGVSFTPVRNPYKGLEAFAEADAGDFFGRSDSVQNLASIVTRHRFVAVVGPSGSGKSSLVKAGLVPAVRAGIIDGSDHWAVTDMYPGSYPFEELESALARVAIEDPGSVMDELGRDERGLVRVIKRVVPDDTRLLLVIDQFEEVFTLTRDDTTRDRFLRALVVLAADERSDTRVVVTLRADFFDRPLQHPEFGDLLKNGMFALTSPSADQLAEAVRRPAEAVEVDWEAGLVDQIVTDVSDEPGTLPLLQYALTEIFATRSTDRLTHDDYRATGGVLGALGSRADAVYHQLASGDQDLARQLLLRLVMVQPSGEQTRRRARMVELNTIADPGDVDAVLSAFGDARLLTFDRDPLTRSPTVEVAHEALLTRWPRLTDWIVEAREDLLLHQRLADAVDQWDEHDRDDAYLLAGGRLTQFAAWADSTDLTLTELEIEYLELGEKRSEEQRTRRRRIRNLVTAGFAAAAVIGLVLATFAFISRQNAAANAELARSRELAASAINVLDEDPELSLLLALEGASSSDPPIESVSAVHEALANHRKVFTYVWPEDEELQDLSTHLTPDGRRMVATGGRRYIEVVDIDTGERLWGYRFPGNGIVRATFTPDGSQVVATYGWSSGDGEAAPDPETKAQLGVHLIDTETGETNRHLETGPCGTVARPESMRVADDGSAVALIAAIGQDPECTYRGARGENVAPPPVSWLDLTTGDSQQISVPESAAHVTPDSRFLLVAGEGEALDGELSSRLIEQATGREVASLLGWPGGISDDGTVVMTISADGLRTWAVDSDAPETPSATIEDFVSHSPIAEQANLSPDGSRVAATVEGVQMWDARTGEELGPLLTGLGSNHMLSFSADGSRVLVGESFGGSAVVLDLVAPREVASLRLCPEFGLLTGSLHVEADTTVVDASCDGNDSLSTRFMIDSDSHAVRTSIPHQGAAKSALSPGGNLVAVQLGELPATVGEVVLRDTTNGDVVSTMDGLCEWEDGGEWGPDCVAFPDTPFPDWPWSFAFSPDGSLLAMAGQNTDAVVVWDTQTGQIVATPTVEHNTDGPSQVLSVAFSPDGERLAASFVWSPKELWLLSTDDWTAITQYEVPAEAETIEAPSDNLVYTPDGETLIATDFLSFGEGRIVFMDGSTLELLAEIPDAHDEGIAQIALNEEGTLLASAGLDGLVKVWDVESRTMVQQIPVSSEGAAVGGVAFTGDGTHLWVTDTADGELHQVTIDTGELLGIARTRLTRTFTETECATYRVDPCPTLVDIGVG